MVLKFFTDPQTGVIVPPVTVFNGGAKQSRRTKINTKKTKKTNTNTNTNTRKTRTRKQKMSSRKRKTMRR